MAAYSLGGGGHNSTRLRVWDSEERSWYHFDDIRVGGVHLDGFVSDWVTRVDVEYSNPGFIDGRVRDQSLYLPASGAEAPQDKIEMSVSFASAGLCNVTEQVSSCYVS